MTTYTSRSANGRDPIEKATADALVVADFMDENHKGDMTEKQIIKELGISASRWRSAKSVLLARRWIGTVLGKPRKYALLRKRSK